MKLIFKKTTLVIQVKDNINFSKNLISYLNSQPINIKIFVADGSKNNQKHIFKKLKHKYSYHYFGHDENLQRFFLKTYLSTKKIKSEFISFCDTDDYLNFECLKKKENFLLKNKDFSLIHGRAFNFVYEKKKILILEEFNPKKIRNFSSPYIRFLTNFNFQTYHSLFRRKDLSKSYKQIVENKINEWRSAQFMLNNCSIISGKIKIINDCSVIRWSGNKYKIHPIKYNQTLFQWFLNKIIKDRKFLSSINKFDKNFNLNINLLRLLLFLFYFVPDLLLRKIIRDKILNFMKKVLRKLKNFFGIQNYSNNRIYNKKDIKKIFNFINNELI